MRRTRLIVGAVTLVALIAVATTVVMRMRSAAAERDRKHDVALEFTPAEVVRPLMTAMPERIEFSGPLMAPRTAVIRAKASGTLLTLTVAEGSRVKAGQSLGTIDLSDLQSRAAERTAGVDSARAHLAETERLYASNVDLANQKFISTNALESSRSAVDTARAQLRSAQAQLTTSSVGIRDAALVAPISGLVGKKNVVAGEKVNAEQELLTVVDLKELELQGVVGTHQVSSLRPGQKLQVKVEGNAAAVEGHIDRIAPTAEAGTRGIRVVVLLPNPGEAFRAGQYASGIVTLDDSTPRLTVPDSAIGQASGQDFVWTLEKGVLVRRLIVTGRRDRATDRTEVTTGLRSDAQVIAARFDTLKEGAVARVVPRGAATNQPEAGASAPPSKAS